jgi:hypothetical protein
MHKIICFENTKRRDHSEEQAVDEKIILEWILEILNGLLWIGFILLRIWTIGGLL